MSSPTSEPEFVEHPRIVPGRIVRRDYQVAIAVEALKRNTLVILPTGLGKTVVALLVIAGRIEEKPGKVLFLAPTKPLAQQHMRFLSEALVGCKVDVFTGETPPTEREERWKQATVICSTPQVVQNDLVAGRVSLSDVTLLIFDEAHRATGNYAYTFLAEEYARQRFDGRVLGITASPGAKAERIREICVKLGIEGVEARTESDPDVRPYVQDVGIEWVDVPLPSKIREIASLLRESLEEKVEALRRMGAYRAPVLTKKELLATQSRLQSALREGREGHVFQGLTLVALALKIEHAYELAESQGVGALLTYLEKLDEDTTRAGKALRSDPRVLRAREIASSTRADHPKLRRTASIVEKELERNPHSRIILFTTYRDTAEILHRELSKIEGVRPIRFVGQAHRSEKDRGLSQREQVEILEKFKEGTYNVLIATSVAEEGLDVPQTDLVIFYEPVPSEIRSIQRRGRTGRRRPGRVVILMAEGTRDEAYHWASRNREKKMRREIERLRSYFRSVNASEKTTEWQGWFTPSRAPPPPDPPSPPPALNATTPSEVPPKEGAVRIVVDHRELAGEVTRHLVRKGVQIETRTLDYADYVLSDRVAVERKSAKDYVSSLLDRRLFDQARTLSREVPRPILLLEGEGLFEVRALDPEALLGSLASLVLDYGISIVTSKGPWESSEILVALAKREQRENRRLPTLRPSRRIRSDEERLQFIVEGLPGVSAVLARRILEEFRTIRTLANASPEDLERVRGIGPERAREIHRIFITPYRPPLGEKPSKEDDGSA